MAAAVLLGIVGVWLAAQATAGRLPARLLSARAPAPTDAPGLAGAAESAGGAAGLALGASGLGSTGGPCAPLSAVQVAKLALRVGLQPQAAAMAVAIAKRESSYNPCAHNPVPPDDSYGLWQINRLAHKSYSPQELQTPEGNARAMAAISSGGTNFRPWTTYTGSVLTGLDLEEGRQAVATALKGGS
jgi:hypothetical protein